MRPPNVFSSRKETRDSVESLSHSLLPSGRGRKEKSYAAILIEENQMKNLFRKFAQAASQAVGSSWAFILAVLIILVWGLAGPMFHYSDTWQLVINTGTTIITFL